MSDMKRIRAPFDEATARSLRAGDRVLITGTIIAARDAAHKRLVETLARGEELPVDLDGAVIYYVGPSPAKPGRAIGAAGPTTAGRMDAYTPTLLAQGLRGMIGKGYRKPEVVEALSGGRGRCRGAHLAAHQKIYGAGLPRPGPRGRGRAGSGRLPGHRGHRQHRRQLLRDRPGPVQEAVTNRS